MEETRETVTNNDRDMTVDPDNTPTPVTKIKRKYTWIKPFIIPRKYGAKDISDFYKKYGYDKTLALIKEGIKYIKQ